jgi:hypothetical protein
VVIEKLKMKETNAMDLLKNRLSQASAELAAKTTQLDLPPVTEEQKLLVYQANIPHSLQRLIIYLFDNQGSRTDTIAQTCALGNVSDCHTPLNRIAALQKLGLRIDCHQLKACNRFGEFTTMGHLFIQPLPDNKLWKKYAAANDATHAHLDK